MRWRGRADLPGNLRGAGGQSLGQEQAGFAHQADVEPGLGACDAFRRNRGAEWTIIQGDVQDLDGQPFAGIDLFAGGLPCPPLSVAGSSAATLSRSGRLRIELILAVGVVLEITLVFGLGLPEGSGLADLGHDLAGPQA